MAKNANTEVVVADAAATVTAQVTAPAEAETQGTEVPAAEPVEQWRDKHYTSRVLVLPSGEVARVAAGVVTVTTDEVRAYLQAQSDAFEQIEG